VSWYTLYKHSSVHLNTKQFKSAINVCEFNYWFFNGPTVPSGPRPPRPWEINIKLRHTAFGKIPLDEWSARPETSTWHHTRYSQETDIYAHGGLRTLNPSKRAPAGPRRRPRGQWDRLLKKVNHKFLPVPRSAYYCLKSTGIDKYL